jgi:hypothetical protein
LLSSLFGSLRQPPQKKPEVHHLGVDLPQKLDYPLSKELLEKLQEFEFKVHDILVKNDFVNKNLERLTEDDEDSDDAKSNPFERSTTPSPSPRASPCGSEKELVSPASLLARFAQPDEVVSRGSRTQEETEGEVRIVVEDLDDLNLSRPESTSSPSSSSTGASSSPNFSTECPRIRRDEDLKDYGHRLAHFEPRVRTPSLENSPTPFSNLDGTEENTFPRPRSRAKMNNFSNFEAGNMNARQAPAQPQGQQMNGMNGVQQWPNVGAQSDMNVLWEYIVKLSDMHEQIRSQTQSVASGMQQIDSMRANGTTSGTAAAPHINGVNGMLSSASCATKVC